MARQEGEQKSGFKETLKRVGIVGIFVAGVIFLLHESGLVLSAGVGSGSEDFGVKTLK